jgi:hypothetical protein
MKVNTFLYFSPQVCMDGSLYEGRAPSIVPANGHRIASFHSTFHFSIGLLPSCYSALSSNRRSKILFSGCT